MKIRRVFDDDFIKVLNEEIEDFYIYHFFNKDEIKIEHRTWRIRGAEAFGYDGVEITQSDPKKFVVEFTLRRRISLSSGLLPIDVNDISDNVNDISDNIDSIVNDFKLYGEKIKKFSEVSGLLLQMLIKKNYNVGRYYFSISTVEMKHQLTIQILFDL